ncbi:hypothetical protein ACVWWO_007259 [Bradyrhizobium sp. F1.13.1]
MSDGPFDVFALIIAVIAFIIAIKASSQAAELRRRLSSLEATFHAQRPVQPPRIPADVWAEASATTSAAPPPLVPQAEPGAEAPPPARHGGCFTASARSEHRGRRAAAAARTRARARLRGTARHALGGVDRRPCARARRLLHGALFDRGRPRRPRCARVPWRRVRAGAAWRRRMVTPQGEHLQHRRAADRQHSRDPHRGRHGGGICDHLRGLRALWIPRPRDRLRAARPRRARHAGCSALARARARGPRRSRRVRDADPRLERQAELLGTLHLSRHRHRRELRPRPYPVVALACGHHDRLRRALDLSGARYQRLAGRAARFACDRRLRSCRSSRRLRLHVRPDDRGR